MEKMKTPELPALPSYTGVKVKCLIRGMKSKEIFPHLTIKRKNDLSEIENFFVTNGYLPPDSMFKLWRLYWNFVMNDYRENLKTV